MPTAVAPSGPALGGAPGTATNGPTSAGRVLRGAVASQRGPVALASLLMMGHQACEALVPVVVGVVIDEAVAPGDWGELGWGLLLLAAVFTCLTVVMRFGLRIAANTALVAAHDLRVALAGRVLHPAGGAEARRLPGQLLSTATADAMRVGGIAHAVCFGMAALAALAVAAVVLLRVSVTLGLFVLLALPVVVGLLQLLAAPLTRSAGAEQRTAAQATGLAGDLVRGLRVLKGMGAERAAARRYRETSREALAASVRAARFWALYEGASMVLTGGFLAVVALVGGRLALEGRISIGELVAAVGLTQFLVGPILRICEVAARTAESWASARRIAAVLSSPPAVAGGETQPNEASRGGLRLAGLRSGRLAGVDLALEPGALVGVVAGDPLDAASLLDALGRRAEPAAGAIELDGVPLGDLGLEAARAAVLVADHDAHLFEGTLAENVLAAAPDRARLEEALAAAGADEVAATLPNGLESWIGERGRSLSGGQRQRVALARALAAGAPVLVLHEPTTAVDAATEARIAAGLRRLRAGRTTLLVTTSPALLAVTDRVAVIEGGRVRAEGTHAELGRADARYRELVLT